MVKMLTYFILWKCSNVDIIFHALNMPSYLFNLTRHLIVIDFYSLILMESSC